MSALDIEGGVFFDPEADAALFDSHRAHHPPHGGRPPQSLSSAAV